ncbi:TPA: hypothetical protein N0F65_000652 [Lagenidium giganteum]|uniref:Protein kinase domain-containing protein n=1 Tax=Lagenidium giganteum TaxID=4803 RepID=A0AAV2YU12_9STRA|nr:TPA: hypothetical protein N0F65_000652 [Lagenidium giganteum]
MNVDLSKNALEGFHWTESEIPTDNVKITTLNLALNEVKTLANIGAPPNLRSLNVSHNQIVNADMRDLRALETLDCSYNSINSIQAGKSKLSKLYAAKNEFASFAHVTFPDSLAFLNGSNNGITTFPVGNFSAMKQLTTVDFSSNNIEFVVGMLLPDKLTHLDIRGNPIKVIELRATDADKLAKMPSFFVDKGIKQSNCSEHASRKTIGGAEMCVLEDSEYVKLYFPAPSASVEYPAIRVMSVVCFCFFILTGIGVIIGLCVKKRLYDSKRAMEIEHEAQPDALPNDVREDPELVALRVNQHEITNMQKIGQGKFALLFLAKLGERQVVVKQMQMSSVKSRKAVLSYMEEIRISTKLDHPRIIKFIGISWSHLYDLSILVEYAEHGNLSEHLRSQRGIKTNREEFTWFETHSDLRPKLLLAIDVAEALVYLQSFATPILHKNIRAEHVLLTSSWECKLSGFGYATSVSTSMRGELGSIAWFAPELLTGGKFNEKTEVYSFGVFMSELDMCEKPFIQAVKSTGAAALTNVEIATEVTQHNLRPSFHEDCPSDMLKIAQECLHQDPEMRPNAMKLFYDLRQAYRTRSNSSAPNSNQSNNQEAV